MAGYVKECCERIDEIPSGIYILSRENMTMRQMGEAVVSMVPGTEIEFTDIKTEDARNYRVDNSKAMKTFMFRPYHTVKNEILKMASIFNQGRVKNAYISNYNNAKHLKETIDSYMNYEKQGSTND